MIPKSDNILNSLLYSLPICSKVNVILFDGETVVGVSNDIEEDDDQSSLVSWKALLWLY